MDLFKKISALLEKQSKNKRTSSTESFAEMVIRYIALWLFNKFESWIRQLKLRKRVLWELYGVCNKTMQKWVKHFCPNTFYQKWNKKRKLPIDELFELFKTLGIPDKDLVLSKSQIAAVLGTTTRAIKRAVDDYFKKIGITRKAYASVDVFPPRITLKLLEGC